jgi:Flp pilus assembly protein TadG
MKTSQTPAPVSLRRSIADFRRNRDGAALVEFAIIAPLLLIALAGISDGASFLLRNNAMHSGLSSSAQYIMSGGSDLSTARQIGLSSWAGRSEQSDVTASKDCFCATTPATCSTLCSDQSVPLAYVKIAATDTYDGWFGDTTLRAEQDVRIR